MAKSRRSRGGGPLARIPADVAGCPDVRYGTLTRRIGASTGLLGHVQCLPGDSKNGDPAGGSEAGFTKPAVQLCRGVYLRAGAEVDEHREEVRGGRVPG